MHWFALRRAARVKDGDDGGRTFEVAGKVVVNAMIFPSRAIFGLVLLLFFGVPLQSWAHDSQLVYVTVDGQPLSESLTLGAMLCKRQSVTEPYNQGVEIAGLQDALPPAGEGGVWTYAPYRWGGGFVDDQFRFSGFYGELPESFRIAVYRPSKERIYVSNAVRVHSLLNRYQVDLSDDGTAILTRDDTGLWLADIVLGIAAWGLLFTLLLILCVESAVVIAGVLVVKQKLVLPRVLATCTLLNCLACPIIWGLCHAAFWAGGLWVGLGVLAVEFFLAVLFEGVAYALVGRFGWRVGLGLALVANVTAFTVLFATTYLAFV